MHGNAWWAGASAGFRGWPGLCGGAIYDDGAGLPFAILPDSLTAVLSKIPTSLFADLIFWAADSPLQRTSNPLLAFAVVIAVTVALFVVAVRAFKWDVRK